MRWNEVKKKGNPKTSFGSFIVTLKNGHVAIMVFTDITSSWMQPDIGQVTVDNPVIAWANIPKPFNKVNEKP